MSLGTIVAARKTKAMTWAMVCKFLWMNEKKIVSVSVFLGNLSVVAEKRGRGDDHFFAWHGLIDLFSFNRFLSLALNLSPGHVNDLRLQSLKVI
jgi:hypothetical protein